MEHDVKKYNAALQSAINKINDLNAQLKQADRKSEIAVIGYNCRFPGGANNSEKFWKLLLQGYDAATEIKSDRFNAGDYYNSVKGTTGKTYTKYASFLNVDVKSFDNMHFEISSKEAVSIDPQHKLLFEVCWEAMENSGLNIEQLKGSRTGVFIGIDSLEYAKAEFSSGDIDNITPYTLMGMSQHSAAGRLAYFYDFKGPALICNTACSSSLVAFNCAVESLKNGQCDMAVVGGVNLLLTPDSFVALSQIQALALDGRCKAFDSSADGYGRGEGCGVVILKRLDDAKKDGNTVEALVKATYVGQDGKTNGFFAPNGLSEQTVMREALNNSRLTADDIDYIEAHGTGTIMGDYIETQAINEVYKSKKDKLLIGSVKSNIGHLEAASGIAGIIKVLLSIKHKQIPPSIHFNNPNPNINWDKIKVVSELTAWNKNNSKRRAGVSSFGISGTLAHVIIEEADTKEDNLELKVLPYQLMTLSAKSEIALKTYMSDISKYLSDSIDSINDIAYSSNITRGYSRYRFSVTGETKEDFVASINDSLRDADIFKNNFNKLDGNKKKIAFLFSGVDAIYKGIAKQFYHFSKEFKDAFDMCEEHFKEVLSISIADAVFGNDQEILNRPLYLLPSVFAVEYALTKIWDMLGIKPSLVIGHSIGEYTAGYYAGIISFEDVIKIITSHAKLMESTKGYEKVADIVADRRVVENVITESGLEDVSLVAVNAPNNLRISGNVNSFNKIIEILQGDERVAINNTKESYSYHSVEMRQRQKDHAMNLDGIKFSKPKVTFIPSRLGNAEQNSIVEIANYWNEHLSKTVDFEVAVKKAESLGIDIFIEIGGSDVLIDYAKQCIKRENILFLPTMRNDTEDYVQLFDSIKSLHLNGVIIEWNKFYSEYRKKSVVLPNYAFKRKESWKSLDNFKVDKKYCEKDLERRDVMSDVGATNKNLLDIESKLKESIHIITSIDLDQIEYDKDLFSFGFDSLMLMSLGDQINSMFAMKIPLDDFFTSLNTIEKLSQHIVENMPIGVMEVEKTEKIREEAPQIKSIENNIDSYPIDEVPSMGNHERTYNYDIDQVQKLFDNQFKLMLEQNEIIKSLTGISRNVIKTPEIIKTPDNTITSSNTNITSNNKAKTDGIKKDYFVPYRKLDLDGNPNINGLKLKYIKDIESKFTAFTKNSKSYTQKYRTINANPRNAAGFTKLLKEMTYQIIAEKGKGSKLIDADGNELIDLTMGFGVNLFGHAPEFVKEALQEEMENGMPLGPMGRLAGQVAEQISELTGAERVFFCNTGTEADMVALRVARAITGRKKIVTFAGAYHGTYDGILGLPGVSENGEYETIPMAPGITSNAVKDLILLNYNTEESLRFIEENADDIAGVLVEVVQSRRPDVQPREYLHKLRKLTEEKNIALIFDEVITGFRICAGGAQEFFGIKADIVTYGKIVGGGMPIGLVTGKAKYLDSIDGGTWSYGDDSFPPCNDKRTMVAGTFCHHPMTMAAANAVLKYIKENKDIMYKNLNNKTSNFVRRVNEFFKAEKVPFTVVNFGSLFRFYNILLDFDIFYYGLLAKGLYIWEGRNCFFSTEHTDEDIEKVFSAIKLTIHEMKDAGYFGKPTDPNDSSKKSTDRIACDNEIKSEEQLPMSLIQERLCSQIIISEADPFDMVSAYYIKGNVDVSKLESAINRVIERHEILRTGLYVESGEFNQKVLSNVNFKINELKQDEEIDVNELIAKSIKRFDLSSAPLFEVLLIDICGKQRLLVFHFHHTVADGISMSVFVKEVSTLYNNKEVSLMVKQYRDYVSWEKNYLNSNEFETDKQFWLNDYVKDYSGIALPYDFPQNTNSNHPGDTVADNIDVETLTALKNIGKKNGASLFMILISVVNVLMHKLSRQNEISLVTPVTNRFEGGFENSIGMFTNTVVLNNHITDNVSFDEFLKQIRGNCLKAYKHLNYPYNFLIKELRLRNSKLFNVSFVYEGTDSRGTESSGMEMEEVEYVPQTQEFDVKFELLEKNGEVGVFLRYRTDLFKEESMKTMLERFMLIVKQVVADSQIMLSDLELVTETEKNLILNKFNNTVEDYPDNKTIVELFEEQVEKTPTDIAISYKNENITYDELNEKTNVLAHKLRELGVGTDDCVAIIAERSVEIVIAMYGVMKSGGAYVPIDVTNPKERIEYIIKDCSPKVILLATEERLIETQIPVLNLLDKDCFIGNTENPVRVNKPTDLIYCIYTSGTTGKPKGVMIEHRSVVNYLVYSERYFWEDKCAMPLFTNCCFDLAGTTLFLSLCCGNILEIIDPNEDPDIARYLSDDRYGSIKMTPSHLKIAMQSSKSRKSNAIKRIVVGGEILDSITAAAAVEMFGENLKIHNEYGPTEATIGATTYLYSNDTEQGNLPIGKPLSNIQIYILDNNKLCGIGMLGEICIAGDCLGRGYINLPELTKERFVDNPFGTGKMYRTGDLARWLPDGNIEYLARIDQQVKIRGFRIELIEIENAIRRIDYIKGAAVIAREDVVGDKAICAYLVSDRKINILETREELSKVLPDYMIPSYIMQIDNIPITRNGKIDKNALPVIEIITKYEQPENEIEEILCKISENVLGVKNIGITDNFYELGGDSIKAIRIVSKMREAGYEISVKDIMRRHTIENMAKQAVKVAEEKYQQDEVNGTVISTPIIESFAKMKLVKPHHYNQAVMLNVDTSDENKIRMVLNALVKHHDILRAIFRDEKLEILSCSESKMYDFVSFNFKGIENVDKRIEAEATRLQGMIDLENGPLMKTALFETNQGNCLLICIHHLVIDGVSWRILTEDFITAMNQLNEGEQIKLPSKTASFIEWSEALEEYTHSKKLEKEKDYWKKVSGELVDGMFYTDANCTESGYGHISIELDEIQTQNLLYKSNKAFNTEINDLLISGLGKAVYKLTGQNKITIGLEGHGREEIHRKIDIYRTVGWFTSKYPVTVMFKKDFKEYIIDTKEIIHMIPNHGLGYGLLARKSKEDDINLYFNYMGEMDAEVQNNAQSMHSVGKSVADENQQEGYININCLVEKGKLKIMFSYDKSKFFIETIKRFSQLYKDSLISVIDFCINQDETIKTVSDFGSQGLLSSEFDEIQELFN